MKSKTPHLWVGLDVGTAYVRAMIAQFSEDEGLEILGYAQTPSYGMRQGTVVHVDKTVHAIEQCLSHASAMAQAKVYAVTTSIAGKHIRSLNSHGIVAVQGDEVSASDLLRVMDAAKAVSMSADEKILHVLAQTYSVDHQTGVDSPLGMSGVRLEAKAHVVLGSISSAQNLVRCIGRAGISVDDMLLNQYAAGMSAVTEDEKELGAVLIDIGAGTTDIAVYHEHALWHTAVLPIAGDMITHDIAVAFRCPMQVAEQVKCTHGAVSTQYVRQANLELTRIGTQEPTAISTKALTDVIAPRVEELIDLIEKEIQRSEKQACLGAGVILTGGTSRLPGLVPLLQERLKMNVRIGYPLGMRVPDERLVAPEWVTVGGLVYHGLTEHLQPSQKQRSTPQHWLGQLKQWLIKAS